MKARGFFTIGAAVLVAMACAAPFAQAQTIKISHQWRAETDARDRATRVFVNAVKKRSPELNFRIYPSRSLIQDPVGQFDAMQSGALEMAVYPLVYAVGKVPEFSITILPGLIRSLDQAVALKGSKYHQNLQEIAEKNGARIVTWWWTPGGFATKDRPIADPKSVQGLKMRAADPYFEQVLQQAGASVQAMPSSEIYTALQTGILDGLLTSSESFVSMRIFEQTKHATVGGKNEIFLLIQPLVMAKAAWDKLTPEQKKAFEEAAAESETFFNGVQKEASEVMIREFKKAGATVRELSDAEYAAWVKLAKETAWERFKQNIPNGGKLIADVESAIAGLPKTQ
ncbi:MAG: transporter substrate-binding protein [Microvirga sp.]|jgi:TRAP-type C4-dicarboxylate transport system substrate-binding protein|nr:transporter substrate-binding protein [Microvirga sp.]